MHPRRQPENNQSIGRFFVSKTAADVDQQGPVGRFAAFQSNLSIGLLLFWLLAIGLSSMRVISCSQAAEQKAAQRIGILQTLDVHRQSGKTVPVARVVHALSHSLFQ